MKIYHYTSLDSLAQILKNRSIMFNRLDRVDDIEEGTVESQGVFLGKYVFVSCWTEDKEESIPMWNMYARGGAGVRIALEKDMFKDYLIHDLLMPNGQHMRGAIFCKLPPESFLTQNYWMVPVIKMDSGFFYRHIVYVDDVKGKIADTVNLIKNENGTFKSNIALGEIGKYKHKRWNFQHETRFVLTAFPKNPLLLNPNMVGSIIINSLLQNEPLPIDHYFMYLRDEVLEDIEIVLSPEANEGHQLIVEALCKQYLKNPHPNIQQSSLGNRVKFK